MRCAHRRWFTALGLVLVLAVSAEVRAQAPGQARLQAHLAAGEFGIARTLALSQPPAVRDQWLREVALAQAQAGARQDASQTASDIGSAQVRGAAARGISDTEWARGGAALADFDSLINLMTTTIAPDTWDTVGGPGSVEGFPGGVYVDAKGVLHRMELGDDAAGLAELRRDAFTASANRDARRPSALRKVSLVRLEKEAQLREAAGLPLDEAMRNLAGITRVTHVLVYPDTGDIVLAGPAEDWTLSPEGRVVGAESGRPTLQLDDLIVLLRNAYLKDSEFGCSITPRKENLAATQAFLAESAKTPLKPGARERERWLSDLRERLGRQDITVFGLDPRTRAAQVLVEADYRMKLVGMGLEEGVLGVQSYLASLPRDRDPPPTEVLRWWFTLNYDGVRTTAGRDAFELRGQGVKVLSENELLTARGERTPTGASDELNQQFARSFTEHFPELAAKYPVYADLQNVFDLALAAALIKGEDLPGQAGWEIGYFGVGDDQDLLRYEPELGAAATEVETVLNHRVLTAGRFVAGVSGGVAYDARPVASAKPLADESGALRDSRTQSAPSDLPARAWWWD